MPSETNNTPKGNGCAPELTPVPIAYPQILDVPPGCTALVVPIDGLRSFVQALSREWLGLNAGFFDQLVQHVERLPPDT